MAEKNKTFINLDLLLNDKKRDVQFLGKTFDLSYIPCGLAIPILEAHNEQFAQENALLKQNKEPTAQEKMENQIKMVTLFCSFYEKEFTHDYICKKATDKQILAMYLQIVQAITENFEPIKPEEAKDEEETKKKQTGQN